MIILSNVHKTFPTGTQGLTDISLAIDKGEFVFLIGGSGSGKTTLLRLLTREMTPTSGEIRVADVPVHAISESKVHTLRKQIGVVFQDLKLLMDRTILENVLLPLEVAGVSINQAKARAEELLEKVGIQHHKDKFPIQLSGGELQRAAIARALTLSPIILLADEPTGNLDDATAESILSLLQAIHEEGTTVIMATHNMNALKKYPHHRVITLEKGTLAKDTKKKDAKGDTHGSA
jgi:cell division transport system ATP-binding protein